MDWLDLKKKGYSLFRQYKYVILVLVIGLVLMLIPGESEERSVTQDTPAVTVPDPEVDLEQILSLIQGVGKVQVLLTVAEGEQTLYEYNLDTSDSSDSSSRRTDVVVITDADRAEQGLVQQVIPPTYQGAIIVCQGGDQPSVRLAIVEAVSDATGLSADKITVLKMK